MLLLTFILFFAPLRLPWAVGQKIYWTASSQVQRADLDGSNIETLVTGLSNARGIALDLPSGKIYWAQRRDGIRRANLDGSGVEDLVGAGPITSRVALDLDSGKMYWQSADPPTIQRANLDGSDVEDLITAPDLQPSFTLDLNAGHLYFVEVVDSLTTKVIKRASLDGSDIETLLVVECCPRDFALDLPRGKLYWTSRDTRIYRANLDGSDLEVVVGGVSGELLRAIAVDPAAGKLYWSERTVGTIRRADLDGSNVETILTDLGNPFGLALAVRCPNGLVDDGEECDDGGESALCDFDCTLPVCGDGVLNTSAGEQCDDGNLEPGDCCDANCLVEPLCGNGVVDSCEECDDGSESALCNADCTLAACGDGVLNASAGEECDDGGESPTCDPDCTAALCGDGTLNVTAGEECDDGGESATCDADCTPVACGDGTVNQSAGEDCEEGGNTATCDRDCTFPVCGDGVINHWAGEECDDGNNFDTDLCLSTCRFNPEVLGPDIIVGELPNVDYYGSVDGVHAYAVGTDSCNTGDDIFDWLAETPLHPVIAQNMYRSANGRFEQIGLSWVKHGFATIEESLCDQCAPLDDGVHLGVGCSDLYDGALNGNHLDLGPRFEVNATDGIFPYPWSNPQGVTGDEIFKRIQVAESDLTTPGALYFVEGQYVHPQDAQAGNAHNNASYRRVTVNGDFSLTLEGETRREKPGISAWKEHGLGVDTPDPAVYIRFVDVPNAQGRFVVGYRVASNGDGTWHYEYAVQNLNVHRGASSFTVPLAPEVVVTNVSFHDVDYHSGEPFDGTDWPATVTPEAITWTTAETYAENPDANGLRWGTLYNFRFDANLPARDVTAAIGLFRPGSPDVVTASTLGPGLPDLVPTVSAWGVTALALLVLTAGTTVLKKRRAAKFS